jgi:Amt family ammonium transporter
MLHSLFTHIPMVIQDTAAIEGDMGMLWMLLSGILVFFMQAGFTLVESGMTRSKNAVNIAMKNLLDICVGSLTYWFVGYSLMYGDSSNGWFFWSGILQGDGADLFFQTMFAATAATIVSGAIAGRTKYSTYAIFTVVMTAFVYPIAGGWEWNGGWLNTAFEAEFIDFAGSSIVHGVGGFAALVAAFMVGPRIGKFVDGKVVPIPGHNQILTTLGVFILWLGWFGFNGGSQLAAGTLEDVSSVATIYINTNLAAGGGVITAALISRLIGGKTDVIMMLNGAIAGLVAITAEPLTPSPLAAIFIGAIGGLVMYFSTKLLFKMKIDDVVGAIPAHLVAGVWGTLAVPLTNSDVSFGAQFLGTISVVIFVFIVSYLVFQAIKATVGLRISKEAEKLGTDKAEVGVIAYGIRD